MMIELRPCEERGMLNCIGMRMELRKSAYFHSFFAESHREFFASGIPEGDSRGEGHGGGLPRSSRIT